MNDNTALAHPPDLVRPAGRIRWIICGLIFAAVVLSYIDRLVISVLKPELSARYGWSESGYADLAFYFQAAYGVAYLVAGRFIDRVGARIGYAVAVSVWTIGHLMHTLFTSTAGMLWARIPLAIGEAATFPAALAATNEWFPSRERALAIGLFNAGSNVGAIVTPLVVPVIAVTFGWRMAFFATGALTIVWVIAWLGFYRRPADHPKISPAELAWVQSEPRPLQPKPIAWKKLFGLRQTWAYMLGRFLIDPVWWTFLFWLPDFFNRQFGVRMLDFGPPLVAIYVLADIGSIAGGYGSSRMLKAGASLNRARKFAMIGAACCALPIMFAASAPSVWIAVALIGLACAGHQGFSANLYSIPGDLFPNGATGTVVGLGGLSGAIGGMLMARFAGHILDAVGGSYQPIFVFASVAYLLAVLVVHLLIPRYSAVPISVAGAPA